MIDINIDFEIFHIVSKPGFFIIVIVIVTVIFDDTIDAFNIFVDQKIVPLTFFENGQSFDF